MSDKYFNAKLSSDFSKEYGYKKNSTYKLIRDAHKKYIEDVLSYSTASLIYPNIISIRPDEARLAKVRDLDRDLGRFGDFDFDKYIGKVNDAKAHRSKVKGRSVVKEIEKMWEACGE